MQITKTVQEAIDTSTGYTCIVTIPYEDSETYDSDLAALEGVSDGDCDTGDEHEFWADCDLQGDDGMAWRVHLVKAPVQS